MRRRQQRAVEQMAPWQLDEALSEMAFPLNFDDSPEEIIAQQHMLIKLVRRWRQQSTSGNTQSSFGLPIGRCMHLAWRSTTGPRQERQMDIVVGWVFTCDGAL
jgi:hypothetical protein